MIRHLWSTAKHKAWVAAYIVQFCTRLLWRAVLHDTSKVTDPVERDGFRRALPALASSTYGSESYQKGLRLLGPARTRHYENNDHHPEHFEFAGIAGMDLTQLVEMYCDWRAAVRRHDDGDLIESVRVNRKRYAIDGVLGPILYHSALEDA